ncbi:MAG: magnesium transporter MgtE N-terminal domain-containing protein [Candidatus Levyibacteriota bacterium]
MAIFENRPQPPISKIELNSNGKKVTISPKAIRITNGKVILQTKQTPTLPFDRKDFYLSEDLLDKQVIDVDDKRLVRVNDVLMEDNDGELKVIGIDIGLPGVLRRLGLGFIPMRTIILPFNLIEAFDYQTGNIKIKLKQQSLATLHPADIAELLEDVGTKERIGIVSALDSKRAALAIEEADNSTQVSILEGLEPQRVKEIVDKMHVSEIADIFHYLNPLKAKEVLAALDVEKIQKVNKLLAFSDDVAGGLMRVSLFALDGDITVKEVLQKILDRQTIPETIIVNNGGGKISGTLYTKDLLAVDKLAKLKDIITERKFIYPEASMYDIVKLFSQYNLRAIPVVDKDKKPIGIVVIDDVLRAIEEGNDKNENI